MLDNLPPIDQWPNRRDAIIAQAQKMYGHATEDVAEQLARWISSIHHQTQERNEALNLCASQAQKIARLKPQSKET